MNLCASHVLVYGLLILTISSGCTAREPQSEREIEAVIKADHGWVNVDPADPDEPVIAVHLRFSTKDPAAIFRLLVRLESLETLTLLRAPVTDADLADLPSLPKLKHLGLSRTKVTDAGLSCLSGLKGLESLNLYETRITGEGFEYLVPLTHLRILLLGATRVTDGALTHLRGLNNLITLELWNTQVTDAGLEHLKGLTKLRSLSLPSGDQITDAGLEHLKNLTQLEHLDLRGTDVTDAGCKDLQKALPNCNITWRSESSARSVKKLERAD